MSDACVSQAMCRGTDVSLSSVVNVLLKFRLHAMFSRYLEEGDGDWGGVTNGDAIMRNVTGMGDKEEGITRLGMNEEDGEYVQYVEYVEYVEYLEYLEYLEYVEYVPHFKAMIL